MEAQSLLSGFCSNSIIAPNRNPNKISFATLPSCSSSLSSSQILSSIRVSLKILYPLPSTFAFLKNKLQCRNSLENVEAVPGDGDDLKSGIRRKNLAVFVSGGGSNFRSIHEATVRGSINGEVVVLVTNKSGCGGAEYARDNSIPVILFPKMKEKTESLSANDLVSTLRSGYS
ncbi:phosphoribosylglycinamide formyltransferase 1 [Sarracenia purpurea var. burkii]